MKSNALGDRTPNVFIPGLPFFNTNVWHAPGTTSAPISADLDTSRLSPEASEQGAESDGVSELLGGLKDNYADVEEKNGELVSTKNDVSTINAVVSHTNKASKGGSWLSRGADAAKKVDTVTSKLENGDDGASKELSKVNRGVSHATRGVSLLTAPLSAHSDAKTLFGKDSSLGERISSGTNLAYTGADTADIVSKMAKAGDAAKGGASLADDAAKGASLIDDAGVGASKLTKTASTLGKYGKYAGKLGGVASIASGGLDVANVLRGKEKDKSKLLSGGLMTAAGVAALAPGVGTGVALGLTAASLAVEHREAIGKGLEKGGEAALKGAKFLGKNYASGAKAVFGAHKTVAKEGIKVASNAVSSGAKIAHKTVDTGKKVASKAVDTGEKVAEKAADTGKKVVNGAADKAKDAGKSVAKKLGGLF